MLIYIALIIGFIITLIAVLVGIEDKINDLLLSLIVFSILFCIVQLNNSLEPIDSTPIHVAVLIAMISYIIFLIRKNSLWRK